MHTQFTDVMLEVDCNTTTLADFIKTNVIDEPQISVEDLQNVLNLKPGETMFLGVIIIARLPF